MKILTRKRSALVNCELSCRRKPKTHKRSESRGHAALQLGIENLPQVGCSCTSSKLAVGGEAWHSKGTKSGHPSRLSVAQTHSVLSSWAGRRSRFLSADLCRASCSRWVPLPCRGRWGGKTQAWPKPTVGTLLTKACVKLGWSLASGAWGQVCWGRLFLTHYKSNFGLSTQDTPDSRGWEQPSGETEWRGPGQRGPLSQ